jgi:recombination protein RecA
VALPALRLVDGSAHARPLAEQLPAGRIVELSGTSTQPGARTTTAVAIVRQAQAQGDTAVWIQVEGGNLFPPDLDANGIDLEALVVVHIPRAAGPHGLCTAAEMLLRSGAWGLCVVDLSQGAPTGPAEAWQGRLLGLCRQHDSRLVLLTDKPAHVASLGALVGLRVQPRRSREQAGRFVIEHQVLKNKIGTSATTCNDVYRGPPGLR